MLQSNCRIINLKIRLYNKEYIFFFFFNDTATTEIYTLSLHDALPIYGDRHPYKGPEVSGLWKTVCRSRSEEHTSELQSLTNIVCRLLLEKKKILFFFYFHFLYLFFYSLFIFLFASV